MSSFPLLAINADDSKQSFTKSQNPDAKKFPKFFRFFPRAMRGRYPGPVRAVLMTFLFLGAQSLQFYLCSLVPNIETSKPPFDLTL
jgi:hypothetical protein